jgi:HK97 family phage prohead protease
MLHKTLEAKATATELGEFTALAAAYTVDRGNERIIPGAFASSIEKWQTSGKQIPLHWDHSGDPHDIIGTVDPHATKETDAGLVVTGKLDLEGSDVAQEAWRTMKSGAMGLSFGYMVTDGAEADDGVYELKAVDVFEISITPAPMNADTRMLSMKSVTEMTREEMRAELAVVRELLDEMTKTLETDVPAPPSGQDERGQTPPEVTRPASTPEIDQFDLARLDAVLPRR